MFKLTITVLSVKSKFSLVFENLKHKTQANTLSSDKVQFVVQLLRW